MKRKITLILLIALILTSCAPQQQSSGTTIDVGSAIENMVEEEAREKELIILTEKERFDKDYGNGVYLKDYSEIKTRLNEEARVYMDDLFKANGKHYENFKVNVDLFNSYYDQVELEGLSFENILNDHKDWIDELKLIMLIFTDSDFTDEEFKNYFFEESHFVEEHAVKIGSKYHIYFSEDKFETEEVIVAFKEEGVTPFLFILSKAGYDSEDRHYGYYTRNSLMLKLHDADYDYGKYKRRLEENYNKNFFFVKSDVDVTGMYSHVPFYASLDDTDIIFQSIATQDEYLRVLIEDHMVTQVQKVIDDLGAGDVISPFIVSTNKIRPIDVVNDFSFDKIQRYSSNFLALYYVIGKEEDYDYELMYKVMLEAQKVIFISDKIDTIYFKLYKADKNDALTFHKLLQENPLTENYTREGGLFSGLEISGNNSEPFRYLSCYGTKEDFMYQYYSPIEAGMSLPSFKSRWKVKNEFMRD